MGNMDEVRAIARDCSEIFLALGDHQRQDILILLATEGPLNVTEITRNMDLSRPSVSHHLKVLKSAGLVSVESKSRENFYTAQWADASAKLLPFMKKVLKA
ncbi:ArsR family transcription repressor [Pontimonas salivibrio]|uniref:ArsR family transcription repressor n=1 Tax=Pontimonas salivibrio TaxID=1159327 RepID=A0A2L2BP68_9MICO|nr:metalloregulator ArsR/SmtB family transcription factor [Pontimonas salivibrio]AVG23455.1 ArsR family transcription repressor [Pontimonas salivibrio]